MNSELITSLSNVILALFTGFALLLMYWSLKEARRATSIYQINAEKQFRLSTIPLLYCEIHRKDRQLLSSIYNVGEVPAYNVDVIAVGLYENSEVPVPVFLADYVRAEHLDFPLQADHEGYFGVYDRSEYSIFPFKKKVVAPLCFPLDTGTVALFLQYRSILGENFSQLFWFYSHGSSDDATFRLDGLEPEVISPVARVKLVSGDNGRAGLQAEGGSMPEYLKGEFLKTWEHLIPTGYTTAPRASVEDRGIWAPL